MFGRVLVLWRGRNCGGVERGRFKVKYEEEEKRRRIDLGYSFLSESLFICTYYSAEFAPINGVIG